MTHLGVPAGWGASAIYQPRGTARRVLGCPPNTDILVLASLSFGLRRRLSAEGVDLLTSAPDSTKTFNLPTRFSATTKALQRRALYRSELPQVQEAKPGTFWDALGRSELACSKHCGIGNVSLAQKLHVMHCPNSVSYTHLTLPTKA